MAFALAILWLVVWFLIALGILLSLPEQDRDDLLQVTLAAAALVVVVIAGLIHRSIKVSLTIVLLILGLVLVRFLTVYLVVIE